MYHGYGTPFPSSSSSFSHLFFPCLDIFFSLGEGLKHKWLQNEDFIQWYFIKYVFISPNENKSCGYFFITDKCSERVCQQQVTDWSVSISMISITCTCSSSKVKSTLHASPDMLDLGILFLHTIHVGFFQREIPCHIHCWGDDMHMRLMWFETNKKRKTRLTEELHINVQKGTPPPPLSPSKPGRKLLSMTLKCFLSFVSSGTSAENCGIWSL